jgi:hypothetical protein
MRRVLILVFCVAFVATGVGGYFAVKTIIASVLGAISRLAVGLAALSILFVLPVFVVVVLLVSGADWFTCIEVIRRLLGLLGLL